MEKATVSKRIELSMLENEKWRPPEPAPPTETDHSGSISIPRFCIAEQHGAQASKYRIADGLTESMVNVAGNAIEAYSPQD